MAQVFMRFPGGKQRALTFSYDDGVEQDVRLIEIFRKYGLKATFNLNSGLYAPEGTVYPEGQVHRRMTESQVSELYRGDDIEVAVHGYTHPWLDHMPMNMCTKDLMDDREKLESQELIRVATKYPNIAKDYFYDKKHQTVEIIKLNGSIELAPLVGLSEVIVDIVETGSTLRENGLKVLEEIRPLSARMVVNRVSMEMERARISKLIREIREVL